MRVAARAVGEAAGLLRSLGHEVEEVDPPWQDRWVERAVRGRFSIHVALSIAASGLLAGRDPSAYDMEPMSWAIFRGSARWTLVEAGRRRPPAGVRPAAGHLPRSLRCAAHPRPRRAPAATRHARHRAAEPMADLHPLRPVHALHAGLQRHRTAWPSRCPCMRVRMDCRWECSWPGGPRPSGAAGTRHAAAEALPWSGGAGLLRRGAGAGA